MPSIELTVKNLDDAAQAAAEQLGVSPGDVKITVLEESKKLFGKVSYKVLAEAAAPKVAKAKTAKAVVAEPNETEEPVVEAKSEETASKGRKKLGTKSVKPEEVQPVAEKKPAKASQNAKADAPAPEAGSAESAPEEPEVVATAEDGEKLLALCSGILAASGISAEMKVSEIQGRYVHLSISGKEASYLIGKSGEVLNSFQYLFNLAAKQNLSNGVRVTLDGNDYRSARAEALSKLAAEIAEKVKERGEEAVLEALPAFERRLIHKSVQELEGVTTYSEGEEPNRRVVIAPLD